MVTIKQATPLSAYTLFSREEWAKLSENNNRSTLSF